MDSSLDEGNAVCLVVNVCGYGLRCRVVQTTNQKGYDFGDEGEVWCLEALQ